MRRSSSLGFAVLAGVASASMGFFMACGSSSGGGGFTPGDGGGPVDATGGGDTSMSPDGGSGDDSGIDFGDAHLTPDQGSQSPIPTTCTESESRHSYIGCDYWPTVTLNPVYDHFDYAVAVSNPQAFAVMVTASGGALASAVTAMIPAHSVQAIPLPWVPALKGPMFDQNTVVGDP